MHSGIMGIYSRNKNSFNNEDREFLAMLSSYAAIALENAAQTEIIRSKNRELIQLNRYDGLTMIFNRRHMLHLLERNWKQCRRNGSYLHVMILDADNFKSINDNFGHDAGDICLKRLAEVLGSALQRSSDCYGRYGGEEFIVSVQDMSVHDAVLQAERIRREVESLRIPVSDGEIRMTVSIGLGSIIPPQDRDKPTLKNLIKVADQNMYLSKSAGRNRVSSSAALV
jgi:diguanylate cyclase (GGDEF)-like protein